MFGHTRTADEITAITGFTADDVERLRQAWKDAAGRESKLRAFNAFVSARDARKIAQRTGTPRH